MLTSVNVDGAKLTAGTTKAARESWLTKGWP
jgi:hypothetical protein